jgi:diacylglycerol kinase (ATP)
VHWAAAAAVLALAFFLRVERWEACVLALCAGVVLTAELFNSALERLAKAITSEEREHVRVGLDIASGAVLMAALTAALVGSLIFVPHLLALAARSASEGS